METVEDPVWRRSQIQVTIHDTESEEKVEPFEKPVGLLGPTDTDWQKHYASPSEPDEAIADDEQHIDVNYGNTLPTDDLMDDDFVPLPPGTQSPEEEHVPTVVEPIPVDPEVQAIHDRADRLARLEALPHWNEFRSYTAEDIQDVETRRVDVDMWTIAISPEEYGRRFTCRPGHGPVGPLQIRRLHKSEWQGARIQGMDHAWLERPSNLGSSVGQNAVL